MRSSLTIASIWGLIATVVSSETSVDNPFTQSFIKLNHAPCVTLYFRNGRVGCGTEDRSLNVGQIKYYEGALPGNVQDPYVMLVEDYDFTAETINTLSAARGGLLQGVLVINSTQSLNSDSKNGYSSSSNNNRYGNNKQQKSDGNTYYSPASRTPMGYNTPMQNLNYGYLAYPWNAKGEGLFGYDLFGMPMAYVPDSDVAASLRQEAQDNSNSEAIVAEFNYYMGPEGVNSVDCLEWKDAANGEWNPKCLPLGGSSVWATAGSPPNPNQNYRKLEIEDERELQNYNYNGQRRPVIMLTASMDATSMFHDISPGANTAASNILTLLMAAKLIGANVDDNALDKLPKRIVFALFQGENHGFIGSRAFLKDLAYPGFKCNGNPVKAAPKMEKSDYSCLYPMRPSLKFADLGQIAGMLSLDQLGHAVSDNILYVHADQNNDKYGYYLANILKYCATNDFSVVFSSAGSNYNGNNANGYPYPPTPLTSLLNLSGGAKGGAVLTGYDYAFTGKVPYNSHHDSATYSYIDLGSIAAAATIMARGVLAAAYDDGSYQYDGYQNPANYAKNMIPEMDQYDEDLIELSNCLFYDGSCSLFQKYSSVEAANQKSRTGVSYGSGAQFPNPPSYYVGVYNSYYGQPFVQVGDNIYGAYDGDEYGNKNSDTVGMMPTQLENVIHGLFNDFLGRGSSANNNNNDGSSSSVSCKKASDCANVGICQSYGDSATCTGRGECVCSRSHFHIALDEALVAAPEKPTGYFQISENDNGYSAMFTEPYWSPSVGVRVYRDNGTLPGFLTLVAGVAIGAATMFGALVLKVGLKKEKLY